MFRRIDPETPDTALLTEAAAVLRKGGIVAFPTDTFYGLAVNPFLAHAVERLFRVKGRPAGKPILLLISGPKMRDSLIASCAPPADAVMRRFWPGPLTIILQAKAGLPAQLTAGTGKIGLRLPAAPLPIALIQAAGFPLTATSANPSGGAAPATAEAVLKTLGSQIDLILDGGRCETTPSTLLDLSDSQPTLLREGRISASVLTACIGNLHHASNR